MADNLTRRQFVQDGAVAAVALASGLASASIVRAGNPTEPGHQQDPQLQPGHGVPPAGQDRTDGLGRGPGRALEAGRHHGRRRGVAGLAVAGHRGLRVPPQSGRGGEPLHRTRDQLRRRLLPRRGPGLLQGPQGPARQDPLRLLLVLTGEPLPRVAAAQEADADPRPGDEAGRARSRRPLADHAARAEHPAHRRRDRGGHGRARLGQEDRPGAVHGRLLAPPAAHQVDDREVPRPVRR